MSTVESRVEESAIEVQIAVDDDEPPDPDCPDPDCIRRWAEAALAQVGHAGAGLTVRVVATAEAQALNRDFRGRDYATNVLSFVFAEVPPEATAELGGRYLGDLAVCADVVQREACEQGKPAANHWAHMVVHGVLHLAGFDHGDDAEAQAMEAQERIVLAGFGVPDPYRDDGGTGVTEREPA